MITGKIVQVRDFNTGSLCSRCGIFGAKKICDYCKPLKECSVCNVVLKGKEYNFYEYEYVQTPHRNEPKYYKEIMKPQVNAYAHDGNTCEECKDYKTRIKNRCFICEDEFKNSPSRFRKYGNVCMDCTGENIENEIKQTVNVIGQGEYLQITE